MRQRVKQNADNMLVGAVLAKYMIFKAFHVSFLAQHIVYGPYGKPYLRDYPHVHFNISHSGCLVACAVSDCPIGVDIQEIVPYRPNVAKHVCTPDELLKIETSPNTDIAFTKIWTQKEAYLKMSGVGLSKRLENIGFSQSKVQTFQYMNAFVSIQEE